MLTISAVCGRNVMCLRCLGDKASRGTGVEGNHNVLWSGSSGKTCGAVPSL